MDYDIDVMGRFKFGDDEYYTTLVRKMKLSIFAGDEGKEHMDGEGAC